MVIYVTDTQNNFYRMVVVGDRKFYDHACHVDVEVKRGEDWQSLGNHILPEPIKRGIAIKLGNSTLSVCNYFIVE